jgi:hypothetical protein
MTVGLIALSTMTARTTQLTASLYMLVFGLGFGMVSQVLVLAIQNAVDRRELGTATAAANFFRGLGGAVGVAVYGTVFAGRLRYWLPRNVPRHLLGHLSPTVLQASPGMIHTMPLMVRDGVAQAVAHSVATVFLVATPIAALGFLVVLFLKEYPLRTWNQDGAGPQLRAAQSGAERASALARTARSGAEQASPVPTQQTQEAAIPGSTRRSIRQP